MEVKKPIIIGFDSEGKISLPEKIREEMKLTVDDSLSVIVCGDSILIRKIKCIFCDNTNFSKMKIYKNKMICQECLRESANINL